MKRTLRILSLVFVLYACDEHPGATGPSTPYDLWRSYNLHNYTIEQVRSCFCINGGVRMQLTVRNDTVRSVMNLSDSTFLHKAEAEQYLSIDSLFGILRYSTADSLVFTFDTRYGFPDKIDINPQQHPFDGGVMYETFNVQPIH